MKSPHPSKRTHGAALVRTSAAAAVAATAAHRRGVELLELIELRKTEIADHFYDIGEALRELHKKKLHLVLGYASFARMLTARQILSPTQAKKLISIATSMPRATALVLGAEKAYATARYAAATPALDTPEGLVASGAKIGGKPIASMTAVELMKVAVSTRKKQSPRHGRPPAEIAANEAAKELRAWLASRARNGIVVTAKKARGKWSVTVALTLEAARAVVAKR